MSGSATATLSTALLSFRIDVNGIIMTMRESNAGPCGPRRREHDRR
ncbi:MAG: hypothetical protein ACLPXZ_10520 [Mycobacterium sp.]